MNTISFIFDEVKATQAAAYVLSLNEGKLNYLKLIKLLYISDRTSLERYHSVITTDSYYSLKFGPVTSGIYDLIKRNNLSSDYWNENIHTEGYDIVLFNPDIPFDHLSVDERALIKEIDEKYKDVSPFDMAKLTHSFNEWQDPGESRSPISIESILDAVIEDTDELKEAEEELKLSAYLSNLTLVSEKAR